MWIIQSCWNHKYTSRCQNQANIKLRPHGLGAGGVFHSWCKRNGPTGLSTGGERAVVPEWGLQSPQRTSPRPHPA